MVGYQQNGSINGQQCKIVVHLILIARENRSLDIYLTYTTYNGFWYTIQIQPTDDAPLYSQRKTSVINSLRPRQNRRHFADDILKCIFLNENEWISLRISLKFVPKVRINNIPYLFQIMAWRRPGAKPLSEPMMVSLLTHICVTRPQLVDLWEMCQLLRKRNFHITFKYKISMTYSRTAFP